MGTRGPAPKRDDQRRRRNATEPVDTAASDGQVRGPELKGKHSAVARRWYEALRRSGQVQFFEPSDWAQAELVVVAIDAFVRSPSASQLAAINQMSASLLVAEGDRRRQRLELERVAGEQPEEASDVSWIDEARRRRTGSG